jgi:hypothetical protein
LGDTVQRLLTFILLTVTFGYAPCSAHTVTWQFAGAVKQTLEFGDPDYSIAVGELFSGSITLESDWVDNPSIGTKQGSYGFSFSVGPHNIIVGGATDVLVLPQPGSFYFQAVSTCCANGGFGSIDGQAWTSQLQATLVLTDAFPHYFQVQIDSAMGSANGVQLFAGDLSYFSNPDIIPAPVPIPLSLPIFIGGLSMIALLARRRSKRLDL